LQCLCPGKDKLIWDARPSLRLAVPCQAQFEVRVHEQKESRYPDPVARGCRTSAEAGRGKMSTKDTYTCYGWHLLVHPPAISVSRPCQACFSALRVPQTHIEEAVSFCFLLDREAGCDWTTLYHAPLNRSESRLKARCVKSECALIASQDVDGFSRVRKMDKLNLRSRPCTAVYAARFSTCQE